MSRVNPIPIPHPILAIDTHRMVKRLTKTGFTEDQAEAVADVQAQQTEILKAGLVTQENLALVEANLRTDITQIKADLKVEIVQVESNLIKWMIGIVLGVSALQTTLMLWLLGGA